MWQLSSSFLGSRPHRHAEYHPYCREPCLINTTRNRSPTLWALQASRPRGTPVGWAVWLRSYRPYHLTRLEHWHPSLNPFLACSSHSFCVGTFYLHRTLSHPHYGIVPFFVLKSPHTRMLPSHSNPYSKPSFTVFCRT